MDDALKSAQSAKCPSLLHYLQPESPTGLRIRLDMDQFAKPGQGTGAFSSLVAAQVILPDKTPLMDLFLLFQPDTYGPAASALRPLSNPDIEELWHEAMAASVKAVDRQEPCVLPESVDADGHFRPFRPLLFCSHKARFCHPLCPQCGRALDLCRQDALLAEAGLQSYSSSLQRYLHCPQCHSRNPVFYTREKKGRQSEQLLDAGELIAAYRQLLDLESLAGRLPCIGCDAAAECHGHQGLCAERMVPFCFYPFYLLLRPAAGMRALAFLPLLGGADAGTESFIGIGRADRTALEPGSGFLFSGDERVFMEILYLKLTFLRELFALLQDGTKPGVGKRYPLNLESVWVDLALKTARLPYYWSFSLSLADIVGEPADPMETAGLNLARSRHFLSRAWFYVLLVNSRQSFAHVAAGLEKTVLQYQAEASDADAPGRGGLFSPGNLLWSAPDLKIPREWEDLWREALELGFDSMIGEWQGQSLSASDLARKLDGLRSRARQALFAVAATGPTRKQGAEPVADARIADILETILRNWPLETEEVEQGQVSQKTELEMQTLQVDADGDIEETIILSESERPGRIPTMTRPDRLQVAEEHVPAAGQATPLVNDLRMRKDRASLAESEPEATLIINSMSTPSEDTLEKTVVINPASVPIGEVRGPIPEKPASAGEDLEKTVVINPLRQAASEELAETVLIGSQDKAAGPAAKAPARVPPPPPKSPPAKKPPEPVKPFAAPKPVPKFRDDLEATVIINPQQPGPRKPKL